MGTERVLYATDMTNRSNNVQSRRTVRRSHTRLPSRDGEFTAAFPALQHFARIVAGNDHDGDDLAVDVASRALPRWRRGSIENLGPYLRQSVVNANRSNHRRVERRRQIVASMAKLSSRDFNSRSRDSAQSIVDRVEVENLLAALTLGEREVLAARFLSDLTVDETAQLLDIHPGTVKSQTSRALRKLRLTERTERCG